MTTNLFLHRHLHIFSICVTSYLLSRCIGYICILCMIFEIYHVQTDLKGKRICCVAHKANSVPTSTLPSAEEKSLSFLSLGRQVRYVMCSVEIGSEEAREDWSSCDRDGRLS